VRILECRKFLNSLELVVLVLLSVETVAFAFGDDVAFAQADVTYKIYCARCHGDQGRGDGPDIGMLKGAKPRKFTDCAKMGTISDDTMFKAIKNGGASVGVSGEMPAWGAQGLSDDDIHNVMKFVRLFCRKK